MKFSRNVKLNADAGTIDKEVQSEWSEGRMIQTYRRLLVVPSDGNTDTQVLWRGDGIQT